MNRHNKNVTLGDENHCRFSPIKDSSTQVSMLGDTEKKRGEDGRRVGGCARVLAFAATLETHKEQGH